MRADALRGVIAEHGPFVSAYVDASRDTEDGAQRNELRWQGIAATLRDHGADRATVRSVGEAAFGEPPAGSAGRAVIAAHGRALLATTLPRPPVTEIVRFARLPYLLPMVAQAPPAVPHVVVLADRVGGRIGTVDQYDKPVFVDEVEGRKHHIHPVTGGGLARGSVENRAEETVRQNARAIGERAVRMADRTGAELIVLAGETRATAAVAATLPARAQRLVVEIDVGVDDPDALGRMVRRLLAEQQAARENDLIDRWHAARPHGLATQGVPAVTKALSLGRVDTLLVTDPTLGDRTVWTDENGGQVAISPHDLGAGAAEMTESRADEALPAAALATDADVMVLTGQTSAEGGVGALLRYA